MSQLDLIAQLRESRPIAPAELRERIRLLALDAEADAPVPPRRRRVTWRRALVVAIAVAGLAVAAGVFLPRGDGRKAVEGRELVRAAKPVYSAAATDQQGALAEVAPSGNAGSAAKHAFALAPAVPPPGSDAQKYSAELTLRLKNANEVSAATNKALKIVSAMGGHPNTVNVDAERKYGAAYLVLKVPRARVQEAVQKLGALGTIIGADVSIEDLQGGIDTTARTITRLKDQLAELRQQSQTEDVLARIETLESRIENLQRQNAATIRAAYFATVKLHMQTPKKNVTPVVEKDEGNGPLHGLVVAFRWIGIGAVYAIALGTPLVLLVMLGWFLARGMRRRREEALLSRA